MAAYRNPFRARGHRVARTAPARCGAFRERGRPSHVLAALAVFAVPVVKSGGDAATERAIANALQFEGAAQFEECRPYLQAVVWLGDAVRVADV
jgi:hypothetical protein